MLSSQGCLSGAYGKENCYRLAALRRPGAWECLDWAGSQASPRMDGESNIRLKVCPCRNLRSALRCVGMVGVRHDVRHVSRTKRIHVYSSLHIPVQCQGTLRGVYYRNQVVALPSRKLEPTTVQSICSRVLGVCLASTTPQISYLMVAAVAADHQHEPGPSSQMCIKGLIPPQGKHLKS